MRLPRWLVIGMLTTSILAVLAAAGWWWVTWPERTVRVFVELVADARIAQAEEMLLFGPPYPGGIRREPAQWFFQWRQSGLKAQPRTPADVFYARQRFTIPAVEDDRYELFVEKDKVAVEDVFMTKLGAFSTKEDLRGIDLTLPRRVRFSRLEP